MTSYRMSLTRHRRRTFLLYKETRMQKWAGMLVETGKAFVDPSVMITRMKEDQILRILYKDRVANEEVVPRSSRQSGHTKTS